MATEQELLDMLLGPLYGITQRRRYVEQGWLLNYRGYQGVPLPTGVQPLLDGSARYFVPHARRVIERNVARRTKLLMPVTDWFETLPLDDVSSVSAEAVHALMRYVYEKKLQTRRVISSLCRCLQLYNFAVLHTGVRVAGNEVWPYQRAVDPFSFYVFPDTATCREEASLIFETCIVPFAVYDSFVDHEQPAESLYVPLRVADLSRPVWPYHMVERLAYKGLSMPDDIIRGGSERTIRRREGQIRRQTQQTLQDQSSSFVQLSKVNFRQGAKWYFAVIAHNLEEPRLVRFDEEYEWPMYQWACSRPIPGELYMPGEMDDMRVLQQLTNSALSQIESNRERVADPPMAMDTSLVDRLENFTFENRKIWKVNGDPNAIFKDIPTGDVGQGGLRAFQVYLNLLNAVSGGAQVNEGEPGRNMPRSGAIGGSLLNLAMADQEYAANVEEEELLTPGLADVYHMLVTVVPPSQIFRIPGRGRDALRVLSQAEALGEYSFLWQGNLAYESTQERAAKLMQFAGMLLQPALMQELAYELGMMGQKIDFAQLFKMVYTYGLGERGLGEIVADMSPQERQMFEQRRQLSNAAQLAALQAQQAQAGLSVQTGRARVTDIASRAQERQQKGRLAAARAQREAARTQSDVQSARVADHLSIAEEHRKQQQLGLDAQTAAQQDQRERFGMILPMLQQEDQAGQQGGQPGPQEAPEGPQEAPEAPEGA